MNTGIHIKLFPCLIIQDLHYFSLSLVILHAAAATLSGAQTLTNSSLQVYLLPIIDTKWATTPNSRWLHCRGMDAPAPKVRWAQLWWLAAASQWLDCGLQSFPLFLRASLTEIRSSLEFSCNDLSSLLCIQLLPEWGLKLCNLLTIKQPTSSLCPWPGHLTKAPDMVLTPTPVPAPPFIRPEKQHILFFMYLHGAGWSKLILDVNVMPAGKEYPKAR